MGGCCELWEDEGVMGTVALTLSAPGFERYCVSDCQQKEVMSGWASLAFPFVFLLTSCESSSLS